KRAPGDSVPVTSIEPAAVRAGAPPQPPADSLVALALATHPRLAARRAAVDAATHTIQVERLGARPDFTLSLRYGYQIGRASCRERGTTGVVACAVCEYMPS